jgi:hypothetical protein
MRKEARIDTTDRPAVATAIGRRERKICNE